MTEIPETALLARRRYAAGDPVRAILAHTGFSLDQLYAWLDGGALLAPIRAGGSSCARTAAPARAWRWSRA
jgi:hypothetical protein